MYTIVNIQELQAESEFTFKYGVLYIQVIRALS